MAVPLANALNLATNTRWIAVIPFKQIDDSLSSDNVAFNLTTYNIPEMTISSDEVNYHGYAVEIPTNVRAGSKEITFEYLMSSDWHQYKILYKWVNKVAREEGSGVEPDIKSNGDFMAPIRVMMLSEYLNPIFEIIYENCWIKEFGSISLDYQDGDAANIVHSFTISYSNFKLNSEF